jgi:hypothetical protein
MMDKSTGIYEKNIKNKIKQKVIFLKREKITLRRDIRSWDKAIGTISAD